MLGGLALDDLVTATVDVPSTQAPLDLVEPGDRHRSDLYRKPDGTFAEVGRGALMPMGSDPLTPAALDRVGRWIDRLATTPPAERCDGGVDDEDDGAIDCDDPDCAPAPGCRPAARPDPTDCADPDCPDTPLCHPEDCADGTDGALVIPSPAGVTGDLRHTDQSISPRRLHGRDPRQTATCSTSSSALASA